MRSLYAWMLVFNTLVASSAWCESLLYFGDSQAALEMGVVAADFFEELVAECANRSAEFIGFATASSSFHHWIASGGGNKDLLCGPEEAVSAILDGHGLQSRSSKVSGHFLETAPSLCQPGESAAGAALKNMERPTLVVANFLGNSSYRSVRANGVRVVASSEYGYELKPKFQNTKFDLSRDIEAFLELLPENQPCLFFTTNPNRAPESIRWQRIHAQAVIKRDVEQNGRCSFVAGINPEVEEAFRANSSSFLVDRYHISEQGSRWFLSYHRQALCDAIQGQIAR